MTDDLIKRLRKDNNPSEYGDLIDEAADRIEELTKQRDELLAALEKLTRNTFETYDEVAELAYSAIASVKGQT